MRIRAFSKNVELHQLTDIILKNCNVVIDAQNYFYEMYQKSGLPYEFGCECDKYADYLKSHLAVYKEANVKCYFIFKGGHKDKNQAINVDQRNILPGLSYTVGQRNDDLIHPMFKKSVCKEVLTEMGMDYVVCQFESKQHCIALAQELKCPIISYNIEFCFSGVPYIPMNTLDYDDLTDSIHCGIFYLDDFINKYHLTKEKIAIFISLTDEKMGFPEGSFEQLFRDLRLPYSPLKRNELLLQWLSRMRPENALNTVFRYLNSEYQNKFTEEIDALKNFICRVETPGVPVKYLLNGSQITVDENDPEWFEKGVALGNVAVKYVNLYYSGIIHGSWGIENVDADDAFLLSFDILAYAYNLMTNFQKDEIMFYNNNNKAQHKNVSLKNADTIRKPSYEAQSSPFENGWDRVKPLQLFEHFLTETLQGVNFTALNTLPENAKLLIVTLVYFSRRKADETVREVYSILLSYVMLGVVFEKVDKNANNEINKRPLLNATPHKDQVTQVDCNIANTILGRYFTLSESVLHKIFDRKLIHAFVEFQHCLQQMNNLNDLCGKPYKPTVCHKTYNGTFAYKFFCSMRDVSGKTAMSYLEDRLSPAPTVLAFLKGLIEVFNKIMHE